MVNSMLAAESGDGTVVRIRIKFRALKAVLYQNQNALQIQQLFSIL
jgi:hypothetical protein